MTDINAPKVPSCYAASLIIANRESGGELLRELQAIPEEEATYGELLAKHLIQRESAWKEEDLWK